MHDDDEAFSMDFDVTSQWYAMGFINKGIPLLKSPVIRVYLAGPLTCVNESDTLDCIAIRKITKRILGSYDHHGVRFEVYDPADITQPGSDHTAEQVYEVDYRNVVDADLVIFHVNRPSLGVGEESQIAATSMVPRVTVKKRGVDVSRMFDGTFTPAIKIEYGSHAEYEQGLSDHLVEIAEQAIRSALHRRPLMEQFEKMELVRKTLSIAAMRVKKNFDFLGKSTSEIDKGTPVPVNDLCSVQVQKTLAMRDCANCSRRCPYGDDKRVGLVPNLFGLLDLAVRSHSREPSRPRLVVAPQVSA